MSDSKSKRMVYIWEENLDFYDSLENKSDFINRCIQEAQSKVTNQSNIEYIREKLAAIDAKNG